LTDSLPYCRLPKAQKYNDVEILALALEI